jgi:hypothetical protein
VVRQGRDQDRTSSESGDRECLQFDLGMRYRAWDRDEEAEQWHRRASSAEE